MEKVMLDLTTAESVKNVVQITSQYDFDIDFVSGRYIVDAKSILGIFSLDLTKPVEMDIHADNCESLLQQLAPYRLK